MVQRVTAFTDTYLPTVNGVTYTVRTWKERFSHDGSRMEVVFPDGAYEPDTLEFPIGSVPFPFYDGVRLGQPRVPSGLSQPDVVHAHTPFAVGLAARRFARACEVPLVASYHTPAAEYATYLSPASIGAGAIGRLATRYERWFYEGADLLVAPSRTAGAYLQNRVGVETPVRVVSNGVDLERFCRERADPAPFRRRHGLAPGGGEGERGSTGPLIGYTGRHGHEKRLEELVDAVAALEKDHRRSPRHAETTVDASPTLVLAGDGPARATLERRADRQGVDARFLGFLDRHELPSFYAAIDVFAFPSPVETQGIVALEAIASGTPVVAVDAGALGETVDAGVTGCHYEQGNVGDFRDALRDVLMARERFEAGCRDRRSELDVARSLERMRGLYESVVDR